MAVYDEEKTKHDSDLDELERSFESPSATQSGSDIAQRNAETQQLEDAYNAPSAETSGSAAVEARKKKAEDAAELRDKEAEAVDQVGEGYTGGEKGKKRRGWITKKRASIVGAVVGTMTIGSLMLIPISGPLQFLNFAASLKIPHFSNNDLFSNGRMSKFFVYSRTRSVGDTRLSFLERKLNKNILADMEKIGLRPVADSRIPGASNLDHLKYWQFDTTSENSPLRGMNPDEIKAWAKDNLGVDGKDVKILGNQKNAYIKADGLVKGTYSSYRLNRMLGHNGLASFMRGRVLTKFFDVGFHPLRPIDEKLNVKASNYASKFKKAMDERRTKYIKKGTSALTIDTSKAKQQVENSDGSKSSVPTEGGENTTVETKNKSSLRQFFDTPGGKLAGGALLGAGMVCAAHMVAEGVADYKQTELIEPTIRTGMEYLSIADQQAAGDPDVDTQQLSYYGDQLVTRDKDGKIIDQASQAESIVANTGGTGGVPLDAQTRASYVAGVPDWLQWAESGLVKSMCDTTGSIILGVVGIASLATGGVVTGLVQLIGGAVIMDQVITRTTDWLSGQAFQLGTGALLGSQADYGVFYAANSVGMQFGGTELSTTEAARANEVAIDLDNKAFSHEPLSTKLFSKTDTRSLVAKLSLGISASRTAGIGGMFSKLMNIPSLFSNFFSAVTPRSFAQVKQSTYDYGTKVMGWSLTDQQKKLIENPIENADEAAKILNGPSGQTYIDKAYTCFGVSIENSTDGWTAIPKDSSAFKEYYAGGKRDSSCDNDTSDSWLRIRAFIADIGVAESYACSKGDEQSCLNSGFGTDSSSLTTSSDIGTVPTGTSQELAKQILASGNISFQTAQERTDFQDVANTGGQTGCGSFQQVSPTLLGVILALSQKYKIVLGVFIDGHACGGTSDHPKGLAVDINGVNPLSGGGGTGTMLSYGDYATPIVNKFYTDIATLLSENGGGKINQYQCFADYGATPPNISNLPNVNTGWLTDSCDHLHMATSK